MAGLCQHFSMFFSGKCKSQTVEHQRVVPIRLDQAHEHTQVKFARLGYKKHIITPVLIDIAVIAVALGIVFRREDKIIVITLNIAMFTPKRMDDVLLTQHHRVTAAQDIIKKCLAAVSIKGRRGRFSPDRVCESLRQLPGFHQFVFKKVRRGQPCDVRLNGCQGGRVPIQTGEGGTLPRF